jgi:glucose-6-phosphate-specific signal transduction histidine kinase
MIEDNGIGSEHYDSSNGKGINAIKSKIAYLNGRIAIIKKKDNGTLIVIELNI